MKKIQFMLLLLPITTFSFGQKADKVINIKDVERIEKTLSADDMQGRKPGTPGIEKAASFIENEFKVTGLKNFDGLSDYRQSFTILKPKQLSASVQLDNEVIDPKDFTIITSEPSFTINKQSGFEKVQIKAGENLISEAQRSLYSNKNYLVLVDTSFEKTFGRLSFLKRQIFKSDKSVVFILTAKNPSNFQISATHDFTSIPMQNIVGVLPGKSRPNEYVVFGGHYDHLGIGQPVSGDFIYNGANDDAAGSTAVIMLAKYYKALNNNERTLIFVTFTAEESGGYGSQYFSRQLDATKVAAMFNIEMIGTESKWGKASAYITGYEMTDMGKILDKNLSGTNFKFYPDPYTKENLFYRSDNATLARLGVPAHTISTSKMDSEPNYHKVSDEISTLNIDNMTEIIKAIALSSKTIINGSDTPSRVNTNDLKR